MALEPALAKSMADLILKMSSPISFSWSRKSAAELQKEQLLLLQELTKVGIDPQLFDLLLSTELDRKLKARFGVAFFVATIFFTLLSYGVIIFNSVLNWGISQIAITALIVETPIQFIGLLYIIARNLFPQTTAASVKRRPKKPKDAPRRPRLSRLVQPAP
jgi:hypothetical protein